VLAESGVDTSSEWQLIASVAHDPSAVTKYGAAIYLTLLILVAEDTAPSSDAERNCCSFAPGLVLS
jgi:hypothetical protein